MVNLNYYNSMTCYQVRGLILTPDGEHVVLTKRLGGKHDAKHLYPNGYWELPGGKVFHPHISPPSATLDHNIRLKNDLHQLGRECFEETGLDLHISQSNAARFAEVTLVDVTQPYNKEEEWQKSCTLLKTNCYVVMLSHTPELGIVMDPDQENIEAKLWPIADAKQELLLRNPQTHITDAMLSFLDNKKIVYSVHQREISDGHKLINPRVIQDGMKTTNFMPHLH